MSELRARRDLSRARPRGPLGSLLLGAALVLGACTGVIGDREVDTAPVAIDPAPSTIHRLTRTQYTNALHDLLGKDIAVPTALEPDVEVAGFATVGGSIGSVSRRGVEQYETAALKVAEQAMMPGPAREALVGCTPSGPADAACAKSFLADFGRRAWRRALDDEEINRLSTLATTAGTTLGDFHQGLSFAVAALLQSPSFLYRVELGTPDPKKPGVRRYTGYEMASRLSFFLWNSIPDAALLDAAESGGLDDDGGLSMEIDRLLDSPRLGEAMANFFTERFGLAQLDDLSKDSVVFPAMSAELGPAAREETLRLIHQILVEEGGDYRELFTTRRTFVDRKLASLYGVPAPSLDSFGEIELPEKGLRRGLLGHASLLTLYAHPTSSSATLRGKFVRKALLCATIPNPPANVNTALPDPKESGPTLRDRLTVHETQPFCASCHRPMDFIGLGLENFDGLGQVRQTENDALIDPSGDLDGTPFKTPVELGAALAEHPDLGPCLVRHLLRYASAAPETPGEDAELERLSYHFADQGYRLPYLLREIALSPAFRTATESP
ncbi:Cellulose-binding domain protein [Minicystis rosea]|nr:Cellulose-binding domain protein [Minicystis rosea]